MGKQNVQAEKVYYTKTLSKVLNRERLRFHKFFRAYISIFQNYTEYLNAMFEVINAKMYMRLKKGSHYKVN